MPEARHRVTPEDYDRARRLRRETSPVEKLFWNRLRTIPKEWGVTFRRQQPIHTYVVDFVCMKLKLVIELDGDSHIGNEKKDAGRDNYLKKLGYTVLRFSNTEAVQNPEGVISAIMFRIKEQNLKHSAMESLPP